MAYRLYLTADAAPVTPASADSGWEDTASVTRGLLGTAKAGANAALTVAETTATTPYDVLLGQWVSAPMTRGGTLTGNVTLCVARSESDAAANLTSRWAIGVVSGDGATVRGRNGYTDSTEWLTTLTAAGATVHSDPLTADIECQPGDRIVVEYGYKAGNSVTTSYSGTIRRGGTDSTDLVEGDTGASATGRSGWVEFDAAVAADLFATPGVPVLQGTVDATLAVEAAFGADPADSSSWVWTDITADVLNDPGIDTSHGRGDEAGVTQPATCTLTLDNTSGDYSLGPQSSRYPDITRGVPIRVSVEPGDGYYRTLFLGFADSWVPSWDVTGNRATVNLAASGTLCRLAQGATPAVSAYRRAIDGLSNVLAYWPCEDGKDAVVFASPIDGVSDMTVVDGDPRLASSTAFDCSAALPVVNGSAWAANVPTSVATGEIQVRCLTAWSDTAEAVDNVILRILCTGTAARWDLYYDGGSGSMGLSAFDASGTTLLDTGALGFLLNGRETRLSVELTQNGADVDYFFSRNDPFEAFAVGTGGTLAGATIGICTGVVVAPTQLLESTVIGHLTVQSAVTSASDTDTELDAHIGETATERIERLCGEVGVPVTVLGSSDIEMGTQKAGSLLALLRECETADQGVLLDGLSDGLTYVARSVRENADVALTLDAATGEPARALVPVDNDQRLTNKVEATRQGGSSALFEDTDGPLGTATVRPYEDSITVNINDDARTLDYASWLVRQGTIEGYRYPALALNLARTPTLAADWSDTSISSRIDVTNVDDVRTQHPSGTVRLLLEGYSQHLDQFRWDVEMVTSPYEAFMVGELAADSGSTGDYLLRFVGDGSTLASGASAGATSLSVATPSGPLWTTDADDVPLTVLIGGDRITVTAISGASSPQTFTVTGATVVRDLASGATVELADPGVLSL